MGPPKLPTRRDSSAEGYRPPTVPSFLDRHMHIGVLIELWRQLADAAGHLTAAAMAETASINRALPLFHR